MIYLLLSAISAYLGLSVGLGESTLLRPLLDVVSPLPVQSVAMLCTVATLAAALVSAFFALSQPIPLAQEELIFLAAGGALGGALGDLISARFMAMLPPNGVVLLQNALLFTLIALPAVYFGMLSTTLRPLGVTRIAALPAALVLGLLASFLSFGAQPLTIALYYLLFDAEDREASAAALTIALTAMAGKLLVLFIRFRFSLPDAGALLWILPGAILGTLLSFVPALRLRGAKPGETLLRLSLFTSLLNMAASLAA